MASPFWNILGQMATIMQVTGVDALGVVSMIVQAARTARRNRDLCEQLAKTVEIVGGLLEELQIPELRRHRNTRRVLDELRTALFRGYVLLYSCGQPQSTSQFLRMFKADDMASMLRQAIEEIDLYVKLFPMITTIASIRTQNGASNDDPAPNPDQRLQLSIQEVTDSPPPSIQEVISSLALEEEMPRANLNPPQNEEPTQSQFSHAPATNLAQEHFSDMVKMIGHSAATARHNRDQCQQLAQQARTIDNLLQRLQGMQRPPEQLELELLLLRSYMLICFCRHYSRSQLHPIFMATGADLDSMFRPVQEEMNCQIDYLTNLIDPAPVEEGGALPGPDRRDARPTPICNLPHMHMGLFLPRATPI